ncbi:hypothetical protein JD844_031461 [Phrynosoma platyrhinos]|uniref:Jhy protein homolog n=1 Tax=Phrynosoma platyrhinos TaxID=52577 RepID=A0ABQ7T1C0_PHRPL|nr:hypothetical protein JD844_031461 [Phrynosoma platyrhinos]
MTANKPSPKGLIQPHVHYSFLQTASEGLSQNELDSESLAQEIEYQLELQKRICKTEKLVDQSYGELEEDSLEKDSLEEESLEVDGGGVEEEEMQIPNGSTDGKEHSSNVSQEEGADRYAELRYNPNWKKNKERSSFAELKDLHQEDEDSSPILFLDENNQLQKGPQNRSPHFDRESSNSCDLATSARKGSYRQSNKEKVVVRHYNSSPSVHSDSFSSHVKECKHRPETDFVEKNKLTLGLATQPSSSYLQRHGKKQRETGQGQAHLSKKPGMGRTNSSQAGSLEENRSPVQHPLGDQVELRGQHGGCHNMLEFENAHTDSNSYREVSDLEPDNRLLLHQTLYSNPSVAPLSTSAANNSSLFPTDTAYNVHQKGKPHSMNLTLARNPLQLNSCQNFPEHYSPCTGEKKKTIHAPEKPSGPCYQYPPHRCTLSEPQSLARHGKHQNLLGHRSFSPRYHAGFQQPVIKGVSTLDPRQICTEKIPSSYVSGNSGPSQPPARILIKGPSPTAQLIQVAERHHREISQLADAHLAGNQFASMFPPVIQRGESDSQLTTESCEGSQPVLSRSNSEGYLLQMEKQKERKEKENRKESRTKGYMKMDVKLGGLGPDYETIKEKSEKIKQQKEYAKQVKEHNLRNITSARKPLAKPENKSSMSRQKALKYAKTIPKPKLYVSRPSEPEPKDEKNLACTLNGENLPPISPLESLQNRHEKEKQAIAAFKTLHIV